MKVSLTQKSPSCTHHASVCASCFFLQRNFFLYGNSVVETGGLFWTAKQLWSGRLIKEEGIRFSGRLWIGQLVQIVVAGILFFYGLSQIAEAGNLIDEIRAEVGQYYTAESVEAISDRDWVGYKQEDLRISENEQKLLDTIPERW